MRRPLDFLILVLKGAGMGAADVVPGVSGGTIAFISGIYEELVGSLKSIDIKALKLLFTGRWSELFTKINFWFLLSVFGGVAISIFSLAKAMKWLLTSYPVIVWSFFFGLILASSFYVIRTAGKIRITGWISFIFGVVAALLITTLSPASTPETWWFIFISGAIGICAMILPGISGAFILLLLGKYIFIITAVSELNIIVIIIFIAGAATGLILFSNLLSWLLANYHSVTITTLSGFMIGSLNKVWPWKLATSVIQDSHGEIIVLAEKNVLPDVYRLSGAGEPMFAFSLLALVAGILILVVLNAAGKNGKR
jgi:putative membrane protein